MAGNSNSFADLNKSIKKETEAVFNTSTHEEIVLHKEVLKNAETDKAVHTQVSSLSDMEKPIEISETNIQVPQTVSSSDVFAEKTAKLGEQGIASSISKHTKNTFEKAIAGDAEAMAQLKEDVLNGLATEEEYQMTMEGGREYLNNTIKNIGSIKGLLEGAKELAFDEDTKDSEYYARLRQSSKRLLDRFDSDEIVRETILFRLTFNTRKLTIAGSILKLLSPEIEALKVDAQAYKEQRSGYRFSSKGKRRRASTDKVLDKMSSALRLRDADAKDWTETLSFIHSLKDEDAVEKIGEEALKVDATIVRLGGKMDERGRIIEYPALTREQIDEILNKENRDVYEVTAVYQILNHYREICNLAAMYTKDGKMVEEVNLKNGVRVKAYQDTIETAKLTYYRQKGATMFDDLVTRKEAPQIYKLITCYNLDKRLKVAEAIEKKAQEMGISLENITDKKTLQIINALFYSTPEGRDYMEIKTGTNTYDPLFIAIKNAMNEFPAVYLSDKLVDMDTLIGNFDSKDLIFLCEKYAEKGDKLSKEERETYNSLLKLFIDAHKYCDERGLRVDISLLDQEVQKANKMIEEMALSNHNSLTKMAEEQSAIIDEKYKDIMEDDTSEETIGDIEDSINELDNLIFKEALPYIETYASSMGTLYYVEMSKIFRNSLGKVCSDINKPDRFEDSDYLKNLITAERLLLVARKGFELHNQPNKDVKTNSSKKTLNEGIDISEKAVLMIKRELNKASKLGINIKDIDAGLIVDAKDANLRFGTTTDLFELER